MAIYSTFEKASDQGGGHNLFGQIVLRREQREAVDLALRHFKKDGRRKFLWNAKMRFGKTLCALQLARELGELADESRRVNRTLIVTHRPVVNASWQEDFGKIFGDVADRYLYGTKFETEQDGHSFRDLETFAKADASHHYVFFVSMQYLRRSTLFGSEEADAADTAGEQLRRDILSAPWDMVVIDEAHEGTRTALGEQVIRTLEKDGTRMLHLSGTPFNLYDDFEDQEIYTWDYTMEQQAKADWNPKDGPNPYAELPRMNIMTYDLGKLVKGQDYQDGDTFRFTEFFRTWTGNLRADRAPMPEGKKGTFVHEADVLALLNQMCRNDADSHYPFSCDEYREAFSHTLWILPGVAACRAMERLLQGHNIFSAFTVVNVAGQKDNGDDETRADALDAVLRAIGERPDQTATITLSCGRLTAGVTVRPWTAVFYLKGSDSTSAATYMQTIFRVQSPDTRSWPGQMKTECYVFDFAPDRSLKMIAETAKFSTLSKDKKKRREAHTAAQAEDIEQMKAFMRHCPVIALEGGQMRPYDPRLLFEQLNQVYTDRIVRNGFNDNALYDFREVVDNMSDEDVAALDNMGQTIAKTTNMEKPKRAAVLAHNGLTGRQQDATDRAQRKARTGEPMTDEEREAFEARKAEQDARRRERDNRITILRGISLRIPLLMYGASMAGDDSDDLITLDTFTRRVDDASWTEFMPRGVTKAMFNRFKRCYNMTRFNSAGRRIRQLAREADSLHAEERIARIAEIFSWMHNPDKETVLTPWRVVCRHMSDTLGGWCFQNERFDGPCEKCVPGAGGKLFDFIATTEPRHVDRGEVTEAVMRSDSHVLEINSKTGLYPLYVAYSLFRERLKDYCKAQLVDETNISVEDEQVVWDDVLTGNIFVVCNTPMAARITKRTLRGFRHVERLNIRQTNLIQRATEDREALITDLRSPKFWNRKKEKDMIKFNAVVGNPPYQVMNEGIGNGADALYHLFIDISQQVSDLATLIHPARFLFNAGKTPREFNDRMLNNEHFKVVDYFQKSQALFDNVDIKGGVVITLWNKKEMYGKIGLFCPYDELRSIAAKVSAVGEASFSTLVGPREMYSLTDELYKENPQMEGRQSRGHKYSLGANIFETFPELFLGSKPNGDDYAGILGRYDNERCYKWVKKSYITHPDSFSAYKVMVPKANGTGAIGEVLSTPVIGQPVIGQPVIGHTDTFISVGQFQTEAEAEACLRYVKSKFARTMLGILKATQDNPKEVWRLIPLQDFTSSSDIDWSQPVSGIDAQLYKKYGLSAEEVKFIEEKIRPME